MSHGRGNMIRHMKKIIPIVGVIYQSKDGNWRGFCYPYDVSCTAATEKAVKGKLKNLVQAYEEVLAQYNNPIHLIDKEMSDVEDRETLKKIWPEISRNIAKDMEEATNPKKYSESFSGRVNLDFDGGGVASYEHRSVENALTFA